MNQCRNCLYTHTNSLCNILKKKEKIKKIKTYSSSLSLSSLYPAAAYITYILFPAWLSGPSCGHRHSNTARFPYFKRRSKKLFFFFYFFTDKSLMELEVRLQLLDVVVVVAHTTHSYIISVSVNIVSF